jgi:hypothetical protein
MLRLAPTALALCLTVLLLPEQALPQSGFLRIEGKYITLATDLPDSPELRELTKIFDAAVPQWCKEFDIKLREVADWKVDAFLMRARERFAASGDLPDNIPNFPYGFQWGNRLWVSEQDTQYYNRHLLLHEGTHWFMARKYGANGPPWLMEGLAEWYGTHRWDGETLEMGVIPSSKYEVPGWGRISLIREQLDGGIAPSLETVLRFGPTAHQHAEAYAWSWAIVVFLKHHSDTSGAFRGLMKQKMQPDLTQTRWLFRRLRLQWPAVRSSWNLFLTDLDYGFQLETPLASLSTKGKPDAPERPERAELKVAAKASWQASGVFVERGDQFNLRATGQSILAQEPGPWVSHPDGVTLEYHGGQPVGQLQCAIVNQLPDEPTAAEAIVPIPIGTEMLLRAQEAGELLFRINEPNALLLDNAGGYTVELTRVATTQ